MKVHTNAALGPAGRLAVVQAIESGMTQKAAAVDEEGDATRTRSIEQRAARKPRKCCVK